MKRFVQFLRKGKFLGFIFTLLMVNSHPLLGQWKIMPLGDSITYGDSTGGFRDDLYTLLTDEGVDFDFVGSLQSGTLPDPDNEGHNGYTADQIDDSINVWLNTHTPNIVLLHIGTNDISSGQSNQSTISEIESIVDKIYNYNTNTKILLSSLIPRADSDLNDSLTTELNDLIEDLFYTKQAQGYNIYYVGHNEVFKANPDWATDYIDPDDPHHIHPSNAGYEVMAKVYFNAIMNVINPSDLTVTDNFNRIELGITWIADPAYQIINNELSNTSDESDPALSWRFLAVYIAKINPTIVSIKWGTNADASGINEGGLALRLDAPATTANGYLLLYRTSENKLNLWTIVDGSPHTEIASVPSSTTAPAPGDVFRVEMYTDGAGHHFKCYVNDNYAGEISDPDKLQGNGDRLYAGVMLRAGYNNNIDDFSLGREEDTTPPAAATLTLGTVTSSSVELIWQAPGDDGWEGVATSYDIRYSTGPITESNFDSALQPSNIPSPSDPGTTETFVITGLQPSTTYYFALKTSDEIPNWSEMSNVLEATTIAATTVTDDFNRPGPDLGPDWTADPELQIDSGELANTSPVEGWGFMAVYNARKNPTEVSFRWGAQAEPWNMDENPALALMLDAPSPDANGYMLWYRATKQGFWMFTIVNGEPASFVDGKENIPGLPQIQAGDVFKVIMRSDASGHHFDCYVNDQFYATLSDPDKLQGNASELYAGVMLYGGLSPKNNIDDFTIVTPIGEASELLYVWGNNQVGTVNTTLPDSLVVKAVDDNGNPVAGVPINFTITQGEGSLSAPSDDNIRIEAESGTITPPMQIASDPDASGGQYIYVPDQYNVGTAEFTVEIPVSGNYRIWGRVIGPNEEHNSVYLSIDEGPESLWKFRPPSDSWFWVLVNNQYSAEEESLKIFPLNAGTHTLKLRGRQPGSKIDKLIFTTDPNFVPLGKEDVHVPLTQQNGQAYTFLTLGTTAGEVIVEASSPGLNTVTFTATALPDVPAVVQKTGGDNQSGNAGEPLPDSLEVTVYDQYGNPVPNAIVTFTVIQGGGTLDGTTDTTKVVSTDNFGKARVSLTLGGEHPTNIVEASVGGLPPVQFTATAFVGEPAELRYVSGDSLSGVVNNPLPEPFKVKVTDEYGGGVEGHPVTFTVIAGGGSFNGNPSVTVQTDSNGIAQATLTLGPNVGAYNNVVEASASYQGNPLAGSPITFRASATYTGATKLVYVSGRGQTGPAGEPLPQPFKVKTTDDNDQPVSGHPVTFKVTAGGGTLNGDTVKTVLSNEDGIAQVTLTLGPQVGTDNNVVEASSTSDGVHPLIGSPIVFTASATVGLPHPQVSTITVDPDTVPADGSTKATITVTLKDAGGNPVPNKAVILFSTGSDNNIEQPLYLTDENGQTHGYISSTRAELKMISARDVTDGIDLTTSAEVLFVPLAASRIAMVSGNDQTGNIGTVLAESLVVVVTDIHDNPIPNYEVTFVVTEGNGSIVEPQPVSTDSNGCAFVHLILDQTPGINRVEAQAPGLSGSPVKFIATGVEATATDIRMVRGDGQTGIAGRTLPVPLEVEVTDAAGNPVWGFPVTFEVALGNGSVSDSVDVTDAYGRASTYLTLDKTVGLNVVKALAPGLSGSPVTFMAQGVSGSPAMIMAIAGDNQEGRAGSSLPNPLVVKVTDIYGNPVGGVEVTFAVVQGDASIGGPQPQTTDENGNASTSVNLGTTLGPVIIEASSPGLEGSPVQFRARIIASSPAKMEIFSGNDQKGTVGRELVFPLEVLVTDAYDNPVPGVSITFVVTGGGGSLVDGQYVTTNENGVASNRWILGPNPGYNEVVALKTGLTGSPLIFTATGETNHYPIFADIEDTTVYKDQLVEFIVTATDDDGDPLTYGARNLPPGATFDSTGTRIFRWLPNADHLGDHRVRFVVFDDKGGFDVEDVVITVRKNNLPPQIVSYSPSDDWFTVYWSEHDTILFSVEATDPDNDSLTYRWINYWENDSLVVSRTNTYILRAENNTAELHTIKVEVSDQDTTVSHQWHVTVETPVKLISFIAEVVPYQGVKLSWETEIETGNVGFNILRSTSKDGRYQQVNAEIIFTNRTKKYSFIDEKVRVGEVYFYKLEDVSFNGHKTQHDPIRVEVSRPDDYQLSQNYPNPFNPDTKINYKLPESGHVVIKIFNILGQEVKTLVDEHKEAGYHTVHWDGRDSYGRELPSGVYYYQIRAGEFTQTKRMILMK